MSVSPNATMPMTANANVTMVISATMGTVVPRAQFSACTTMRSSTNWGTMRNTWDVRVA